MLYLDIVFKHGPLALASLLSFFVYFGIKSGVFLDRSKASMMIACLMFVALVFSLKANSVFHNIFMFTCIYMITYFNQSELQVVDRGQQLS